MTRKEAKIFIKAIKELRKNLSMEDSLKYQILFPKWENKDSFKKDEKISYKEKLYIVLQNHERQELWTPEIALTLFQPIDIVNEGTLQNPIIAAAGMIYHKDKYYLDEIDNNIYQCIRDDTGTGTQLYYMPHDLVGAYFKLIQR